MENNNESIDNEKAEKEYSVKDAGAQPVAPRGRGKWFRFISACVLLFFAAAVFAGWWFYKKYAELKEIVDEAGSMLESNMAAAAVSAGIQGSRRLMAVGLSSGSAAQGGIAVLPFSSGYDPQKTYEREPAQILRDSARMLNAVAKYGEKPLVKEFIKDLNSDPEFKKIWESRSSGNPVGLFMQAHNMKGLLPLLTKYMNKPGFKELLMEIAGDPDMAPYLSGSEAVSRSASTPLSVVSMSNHLRGIAPGKFKSAGGSGMDALPKPSGRRKSASGKIRGDAESKDSGGSVIDPSQIQKMSQNGSN